MRPRWPLSDRIAAVEAYARGGLPAAAKALPSKSPDTVRLVLTHMGIHKTGITRRLWTTHEQATVRRMWRDGATVAAIAKALDRTDDAVWARAKALGLAGKRSVRWTPGVDRIIDAEVDALVERLAQRFGRTTAAMRCRIGRSLFVATKRDRSRRIPDLGGMAVHAVPRRRAA